MIIILIVSVSTFIFALMIGLIALLMMISQGNGFRMSNEQRYTNNITKWPRYMNFSMCTILQLLDSLSQTKSAFYQTHTPYHTASSFSRLCSSPSRKFGKSCPTPILNSLSLSFSLYMAFSSSSFEVATAQV